MCLDSCSHLFLNPGLEGFYLFKNFIRRHLVARVLELQVLQLSTEEGFPFSFI